MTAPYELTATEAAQLIRAGKLTVEKLARSCIARIAERDPLVHGWAYFNPDHVLDRARELDKMPYKGPLHGIPIGVKDVIDTYDMPTRHNSPRYFDNRPSVDAACVMTLRAAGALIFGKTETVEFASAGRQPLTRNPQSLDDTAGGSSSGSAATVADLHVPIALGTQTGGSTIRPASFCGIFAMKPTWGVVSREGAKGQSISTDTVGWFARSVADLELICDTYAIEDDISPEPFSVRGAKIAICQSPVWKHAETGTRDVLTKATALLQAAGAEIVELNLPELFTRLADAQEIIQQGESHAVFLSEYRLDRAGLHPDLRSKVENKSSVSRRALRDCYDLVAQCRVSFEKICESFDTLLTPSAPGEAPRGLQSTGWDIFNRIWSLLHAPCVNIPGFIGARGLPIGLTVTGPRFTDRKLLAVAAELDRCFTDNRAA